MSDEDLRKFSLEQAVILIQSLKGTSFGYRRVAPMELADLLFNYIRKGEAKDPDVLRFG